MSGPARASISQLQIKLGLISHHHHFLQGEIVDNSNHTFLTQKWGATRDTDLKHWRKFMRGFAPMEPDVVRYSGRSSLLSSSPFIFMR